MDKKIAVVGSGAIASSIKASIDAVYTEYNIDGKYTDIPIFKFEKKKYKNDGWYQKHNKKQRFQR